VTAEIPATPVFLGAATLRHARPGDEFVVRFAAYTEQHRSHVAALFRQESPRSEALLDLHSCQWQVGTVVTARLSARDLSVDNDTQSFTWDGKWRVLRFDVSVPPSCPAGTVVLRLDIAVEGVTVAMLRPEMEIGADPSAQQAGGMELLEVSPPRTAFASYSTQDRAAVLDRVRSLQICTGMDVFLDCLSLRPGQQWQEVIREEIRRRDVFWLFWSRNARASPWVEWEWRAALEAKPLERIQPHPLEPSDIAPPPPELQALQFGSAFEVFLATQRSTWFSRTACRCVTSMKALAPVWRAAALAATGLLALCVRG
jgi:hypothetical protein